jgi:glucokinase
VITKYYKKYAFHALEETPVVLATLGNDAGMYGGVKMVLS